MPIVEKAQGDKTETRLRHRLKKKHAVTFSYKTMTVCTAVLVLLCL